MKARWLLCTAALVLHGCGLNDWLEGKDRSPYRTSRTLPPLEVPPDLTSPTRDNRYAVPDKAATTTATLSGYQAERRETKPVSSGVLPALEGMRVERDGTQRWLVVDQPPEKLWPLVKDFWLENGFLVKTELPQVGVMETDWAEKRPQVSDGALRNILSRALGTVYSAGERDKFRTRLERAADGKSTEIYISHRGLEEVYETREAASSSVGQTKWQARPSDPGLEAEYLSKLMVRLGAGQDQAREAVQTAAAEPQRAQIKKGISGELLEVYEPFDRAWRRVGLALDRVGFTVEDRDRQKGLYFVRYADPEAANVDKRGFFSRIFSNSRQLSAEQYRVQVKPAGEASQVNVLNKDGAADDSQTAQRILGLLHEQLK